MSLVVDLLLLDESPHAVDCDGGRLTTAKSIYLEIERQLQDGSSHMRRKSAFGALIARGASIRFVRLERHARLTPNQVAAAALPDLSAWPGATTRSVVQSSDENRHFDHEWACETVWAKKPQPLPQPMTATKSPNMSSTMPLSKEAATTSTASVPRIEGFPRGPGRVRCANVGGQESFFNSVFDWWVACVTPTLKRKPCAIAFSDQPEVILGTCAPEPAGPHISREEVLAAQHEAGLGGWPLCVPRASVAFLEGCGPTGQANGSSSRRQHQITGGKIEKDPIIFQKVAVEVDDTELVIIMSRSGRTAAAGGCHSPPMAAVTPSTASTMDPPWAPTEIAISNQPIRRLVFPREQLLPVRLLANADAALLCSTPELPAKPVAGFPTGDISTIAPWPHVVEVSTRPLSSSRSGTSRAVVLLIALPCAPLASRLHDALTRVRRSHRVPHTAADTANVRRKSDSNEDDNATLGAVRCELHIHANLEITNADQVTNCAAVVRRGLLEACHIGNKRLVVCTVREGNSGPVPLDPIQAPLSEATPSPTDASSPTVAGTASPSPDSPQSVSKNRKFLDPGDDPSSMQQPSYCEDGTPPQASSTCTQKPPMEHDDINQIMQKQPSPTVEKHPRAQQAGKTNSTKQSGGITSFTVDTRSPTPLVETIGTNALSGKWNGFGDTGLFSKDISSPSAEIPKRRTLSADSKSPLRRRSDRRATASAPPKL